MNNDSKGLGAYPLYDCSNHRRYIETSKASNPHPQVVCTSLKTYQTSTWSRLQTMLYVYHAPDQSCSACLDSLVGTQLLPRPATLLAPGRLEKEGCDSLFLQRFLRVSVPNVCLSTVSAILRSKTPRDAVHTFSFLGPSRGPSSLHHALREGWGDAPATE